MSTIPARAAGAIALAGRTIARIGYGMGALTRAVSAGHLTGDAAVSLLRHAKEEGVQFFDTAEFYGQGLANQLLARAFGSHRDDVVLATKVGARPVPGAVPMTAAQRPDELRQAVEANLRSLGTDRLDLVHLRRMDMPPGLVITDPQQLVDLDDQLAALEALRESGTIGAIGLSHVSLAQLERALPAGISAVSNIYTLLDRTHEPLLRLAETNAIVWAPYFPLGGGGWAGLPRVADAPEVTRAAQELHATPSQVGLAWLLAHSPQSLAIAGTADVDHLDENIAAAALRLPPEVLARLDTADARP